MSKMKPPAGEDLAENLDREMQKFKLKVCVNHPGRGGVVINATVGGRVPPRGVLASNTVDEALLDMGFYEGCSDEGEGLVLFWCHVCVLLRVDVRDGPRVSLLSVLFLPFGLG